MSTKTITQQLIEQIENELGDPLSEIIVEDVRIGIVYTGVKLSTGHGGVAATQHSLPISSATPVVHTHCETLPDAGEIAGLSAADILAMAASNNLFRSGVVIATISALATMMNDNDPHRYTPTEKDVLDLIQPGDRVAMVGHFGPLIPRILTITNELCVVEQKEIADKRITVVPPEEAGNAIPSADVAIITASTLVNWTIDELLQLAGSAREVVLLGPTTPMLPRPLFASGFTAVMGTAITDADRMLQIVSEVGGTKHLLKKCGRKVAAVKKTV
ncbi:MAG: DUF364 domain-containing protein [Euryarchaeota archaeon]|nr:DUF364 domain-containing protein [Euryarchaeota archaeon]